MPDTSTGSEGRQLAMCTCDGLKGSVFMSRYGLYVCTTCWRVLPGERLMPQMHGGPKEEEIPDVWYEDAE